MTKVKRNALGIQAETLKHPSLNQDPGRKEALGGGIVANRYCAGIHGRGESLETGHL